jgi:hypothetical protein
MTGNSIGTEYSMMNLWSEKIYYELNIVCTYGLSKTTEMLNLLLNVEQGESTLQFS